MLIFLQTYFSDVQDDLKRNGLCQLKVHDFAVTQYLLYALVHDNPDLVSNQIQDYDDPLKLTPFEAWPVSAKPGDTIYREAQIEKIGTVQAAIVKVEGEVNVNFKFPVLSSDFRSKYEL